ncbi:MAG: hypothetical protein PHG99_07080 [Erysipelotrichaceae bacterium]|nr:hypothetical protein [Erysipelotrichaceae bacterium]MDD4643241.1 hypothetical protein [Erysipelotrichaceae bacterium]
MKPSLRIATIGMLAATTLASQVLLASLPNVEIVTLLFIIYAINLKLGDALSIILVFTILEGLIWGFADWMIGYIWIWSLLVLLANRLRNAFKTNNDLWALLAGCWGLAFGLFFAVQWAILYGLSAGYAYWIKGIVFDLIHMGSNYIIVLLLFKPTNTQFYTIFKRLESAYGNHD